MIDTAEQLSGLPVDTVVRDGDSGLEAYARQADEVFEWVGAGSAIEYTSAELLHAHPEGLHVASIPVDALLSDEAVRAAAGIQAYLGFAKAAIRGAIVHVTGEEL